MKNKIYIKHVLFLLIAFVISNVWVKIQYDKVNANIIQNLRYVSDNIYRFAIKQFNSNDIETEYIDEGIIFFNKKINKIKKIDKEVNNLFKELSNNEIIGSSLWAIASVYPEFMYVKPWRDEYKDLGTKFKNGYFNYIVGIESLNYVVKPDLSIFETIVIYGPYIENGTNNELYTIYFPLYFDRELQSIIIIDLKSNFVDRFINNYNKNNFSYFQIEKTDLNKSLFDIIAMKNIDDKYKSIIKKPIIFLIVLNAIIYFGFICFEFVIIKVVDYVKSINLDELTGFYNRKKYLSMKRELLINTLLVIDIDHFKKINDSYGHAIGDNVIKEVCLRIRKTIRNSDIAIRWGGEEFVIIFYGLTNVVDLERKLDEIISIINSELIDGIAVTVSIGAVISEKAIPLGHAFNHADSALYSSKKTGRNKYTICDVE
ncbi:GGDEF domain-containing protein [Photobacterium damselae subsp. damselae]|uniref:GGDEF domain-containing protein n=1 Tax=Photobacterium damselae TaxID=38293 RepID=UPI0010FF09C5|nr:GGDEF domain-containing protein [Photobacterium damselae]TLS81011.1 GGDEF domain-containing protein [Photobacterium damselae subsp. damselae]TLS87497.1 GGDEF domain-containing protein [Photobacterium damselae subsp. damselae]